MRDPARKSLAAVLAALLALSPAPALAAGEKTGKVTRVPSTTNSPLNPTAGAPNINTGALKTPGVDINKTGVPGSPEASLLGTSPLLPATPVPDLKTPAPGDTVAPTPSVVLTAPVSDQNILKGALKPGTAPGATPGSLGPADAKGTGAETQATDSPTGEARLGRDYQKGVKQFDQGVARPEGSATAVDSSPGGLGDPNPSGLKPAAKPLSQHEQVVEKSHAQWLKMVQAASQEGRAGLFKDGIPAEEEEKLLKDAQSADPAVAAPAQARLEQALYDSAVGGLGPHGINALIEVGRLAANGIKAIALALGFSPVFYAGTKKTVNADPATLNYEDQEVEHHLGDHKGLKTSDVANVKEGAVTPASAVGLVSLFQLAHTEVPIALGIKILGISYHDPADSGHEAWPGQKKKGYARKARARLVLEDQASKRKYVLYLSKSFYDFPGVGEPILGLDHNPAAKERMTKEYKKFDEDAGEHQEPMAMLVDRMTGATAPDKADAESRKEKKSLRNLFMRGPARKTAILGLGDSAGLAINEMEPLMQEEGSVGYVMFGRSYAAKLKDKFEGIRAAHGTGPQSQRRILLKLGLKEFKRVVLTREGGRVTWRDPETGQNGVVDESRQKIYLEEGESRATWRVELAEFEPEMKDGKPVVKNGEAQLSYNLKPTAAEVFFADNIVVAFGYNSTAHKKAAADKKDVAFEAESGKSRLHDRIIRRGVKVKSVKKAGQKVEVPEEFFHYVGGPGALGYTKDPLVTEEELKSGLYGGQFTPAGLRVWRHRIRRAVGESVTGILAAFGRTRRRQEREEAAPEDSGAKRSFSLKKQGPPRPELSGALAGAARPNPNMIQSYFLSMLADILSGARSEGGEKSAVEIEFQRDPQDRNTAQVTISGLGPKAGENLQDLLEGAGRTHPDLLHYLDAMFPRYGHRVRARFSLGSQGTASRGSVHIASNSQHFSRKIDANVRHDLIHPKGARRFEKKRYDEILGEARPINLRDNRPPELDKPLTNADITAEVQKLYAGHPDYAGRQVEVKGPYLKKESGAHYYLIWEGDAVRAVLNLYPPSQWRQALESLRRGEILAYANEETQSRPDTIVPLEVFNLSRHSDVPKRGQGQDQLAILWTGAGGSASLAELLRESQEPRRFNTPEAKREREKQDRARLSRILEQTGRALARIHSLGESALDSRDEAKRSWYAGHLGRHLSVLEELRKNPKLKKEAAQRIDAAIARLRGIVEALGQNEPAWAIAFEHGDPTPGNIFPEMSSLDAEVPQATLTGLYRDLPAVSEGKGILRFGDARLDFARLYVRMRNSVGASQARGYLARAILGWLKERGLSPRLSREILDDAIQNWAAVAEAESLPDSLLSRRQGLGKQ